ncbi:MAG: carboxypeptidase regulatory-like domain-containing protein [Acidobacteria bacterium]|nr:carboxypeptidase regulatory-like domain-containing protein [Acidobacteriota bacterium]
MKPAIRLLTVFQILALTTLCASAKDRRVSGTVVTARNEVVAAVTVVARVDSGEQRATTDADGRFQLLAPSGRLLLRVEGAFVAAKETAVEGDGDATLKHRTISSLRCIRATQWLRASTPPRGSPFPSRRD